MKMTFMAAVLCTVMVFQCAAETSPSAHVAADIQKQLPDGWTCTFISEKGKMGHPHGLAEPLFRMDFTNTNQMFKAEIKKGQDQPVHPSLRLHFHAKEEREGVLKTIEAEGLYSWDIPILFAETKEYLVVTSPGWQNHGVYTEEAQTLIAPLLQTLKAFFDAKK